MKTRSVCETLMSLVMANSKDGQGHNDKYFDTNKKISSQEMLMCEKSGTHCKKLLTRLKISKSRPNSRSRLKNIGIRGKVLSQEILLWNIKALALTIQKIISQGYCFKKEVGQTPRLRSQSKKSWFPWNGLVTGNTRVKSQSSSLLFKSYNQGFSKKGANSKVKGQTLFDLLKQVK